MLFTLTQEDGEIFEKIHEEEGMNIKEKVQEIKNLHAQLDKIGKILASEGTREISIKDNNGNYRNIFEKETIERVLEVIKDREKEITKQLQELIK